MCANHLTQPVVEAAQLPYRLAAVASARHRNHGAGAVRAAEQCHVDPRSGLGLEQALDVGEHRWYGKALDEIRMYQMGVNVDDRHRVLLATLGRTQAAM
jgi:hypothetical protein